MFHSCLNTIHFHFGPGHVLMNFLNFYNEVVDLIYSGNVFHMFAPKALKVYEPRYIAYLATSGCKQETTK